MKKSGNRPPGTHHCGFLAALSLTDHKVNTLCTQIKNT